MCGFVGFLSAEVKLDTIESMVATLISRGPDSQGVWVNQEHMIALGHTRLSILELSELGSQPMQSSTGRYVMVYNGEVYNHKSLRDDIEKEFPGKLWRGGSDTETLLAGFECWGVIKTIERSIGMFAFALWDQKMQLLTLGRDRLGEKPLYFGWQGEGSKRSFLFGSDVRSFRRHPSFAGKINRNSLNSYLRHGYISGDKSIYEGIHKLKPGTLLNISINNGNQDQYEYWNINKVFESSSNLPIKKDSDYIVSLHELLRDSVNQQMLCDVQVGVLLSGGIDSSLIAALAQEASKSTIATYSIGFSNKNYNEASHAKNVAKHLGSKHTEYYLESKDCLSVIPKLPYIFSEPFADSSQIPTYLVAKLASNDVSVVLSGDGGDELFAGYNRYTMTSNFWPLISRIPFKFRLALASMARHVPLSLIIKISSMLEKNLPMHMRLVNFVDKYEKIICAIGSRGLDELYEALLTHGGADDLLKDFKEETLINQPKSFFSDDPVLKMMQLDSTGYLPDDILVKVDRALMGVSIEGRIPFLDHRVFEMASQLPMNLKIRNGVGKWILREILYKYVPPNLVNRPKMGFAVPIGEWLRKDLRGWAEDLLDPSRIRDSGYLNELVIRKKWDEHISGKRDHHKLLWNVLMFQAWLETL